MTLKMKKTQRGLSTPDGRFIIESEAGASMFDFKYVVKDTKRSKRLAENFNRLKDARAELEKWIERINAMESGGNNG